LSIALLTNYLTPYRMPLYERLAARHGVEVLCFGGRGRYVPEWFAHLDAQLEAAPFPARRIHGARGALAAAGGREAVIAPFAGGRVLPAAYLGARARRRPFVLWASVWTQPRSAAHALTLPLVHRIYRDADAVLAYGEHVRRFVAHVRGREDDVVVVPQCVEAGLFGRAIGAQELAAFRSRHQLGEEPFALYVGRLVREKGVGVLLEAAAGLPGAPRVVLIGDGPLAPAARASTGVRLLGPLSREQLPIAYAAAACAVLPSVPTPRFIEPWGLVCNEAMHQGRPVIATRSVGAVAGGLVRDGAGGLIVSPGDAGALARAIARLLGDRDLCVQLGAAARAAVAPYTYDAAEAAVARGLGLALARY
jgi:glycosyltransferase involved in cell wall biosynthesis